MSSDQLIAGQRSAKFALVLESRMEIQVVSK